MSVKSAEVENRCVGEGIPERFGEGLAEGVLDTADSLVAGVVDDRSGEVVLDDKDVEEATLEVDLGSCVLRPERTEVPTLAQMASP